MNLKYAYKGYVMDRLKIGGLKISFALCQFELKGMEPPQKILSNISKALSTEN